jgi:hypothetical protein
MLQQRPRRQRGIGGRVVEGEGLAVEPAALHPHVRAPPALRRELEGTVEGLDGVARR